MASSKKHPVAFISYAHDDDKHNAWVLKLTYDLIQKGVDARIDKYEVGIGDDIHRFISNGMSTSDYIILVLSSLYVKKYNAGKGGVGFEGSIISSNLLKNTDIKNLIPIIRHNPSKERPIGLGTKKYIDFSDDQAYFTNFNNLLARIQGEDKKLKPAIGKNPFDNDISTQINQRISVQKTIYSNPNLEGSVEFRFDNNNGSFQLGSGEYLFSTHWSRAGNNSIHAYGRIGFRHDTVDYPTQEELIEFDFTSSTRTIRTGQIFVIENEKKKFVAIKLGTVNSSGHGHPYDCMWFDYKILY